MYTALAIGVHFCCMQLGKLQLVTFFFFIVAKSCFSTLSVGFLMQQVNLNSVLSLWLMPNSTCQSRKVANYVTLKSW